MVAAASIFSEMYKSGMPVCRPPVFLRPGAWAGGGKGGGPGGSAAASAGVPHNIAITDFGAIPEGNLRLKRCGF